MTKENFIGLGVAGNFTHHLEQAGEATGFTSIQVDSEHAPKGIFPWYVPGAKSFLAKNPLSSTQLIIPSGVNVQAEPELALICDITYKDNQVASLTPRAFTAFNDASLRTAKPKISLKKNWGKNTQGLAGQTIDIDTFAPDGILGHFMLGSWLKRYGKWHLYGEVSQVRTYSYFYEQLIQWLIDKCNHQKDNGPLESISELLKTANYPEQAYIAIGATRYTDFGENTYLQEGDEVAVVLFDERAYTKAAIEHGFRYQALQSSDQLAVLRQTVVNAGVYSY